MGLDARKPVFKGLGTTQAQTICTVCSAPLLFPFCKVPYQLAASEISLFWLVSVAEQAGLNLTLPKTSKKGFVAMTPI